VWSFFFLLVLEAAALKAWINPGGNRRPQPDLHGEQRVDFDASQFPTLFAKNSLRSVMSQR
jgi:hypothetical protein